VRPDFHRWNPLFIWLGQLDSMGSAAYSNSRLLRLANAVVRRKPGSFPARLRVAAFSGLFVREGNELPDRFV
jgi:hypothetical protein